MRYTAIFLAALLGGCIELREDIELKELRVNVDCEKRQTDVLIKRDTSGKGTEVAK